MDKMIIYKIQNKIDGKIYIGQTLFTFHERYGSGKWWKNTSCKHLKRAAKKYGHENFSIEILEKNIKSPELLDELERFYIKKYDCMEPNGYNINSGGSSKHFYSKEQREVTAKSIRGSDFVELKNQISGEVIKIINVSEFCAQRNISDGHICDVLKGKVLSCNYWTLPNVTMRFWILKHDDGTEEKVIENDGRKFCQKHGLKPRDFELLVQGYKKNGWRVTFFQPRIGWLGSRQKSRTHAKTRRSNTFLSGSIQDEEKIYLMDFLNQKIHCFDNSYGATRVIKDSLLLASGITMINSFLLKKVSVLEDRFILVDFHGRPTNEKVFSLAVKKRLKGPLKNYLNTLQINNEEVLPVGP